MSNPIPNLLALTSIADGSPQQAAPLRNNYSAIQTAANALITALKGGTAGALLYATDASDVAYLPDAPNDGDALVWNAAASRWKPVASSSGGALDYAQITASPANVTATTEGTAVAQITGASVTYDGTKVKIDVGFAAAFNGVNGSDPASDFVGVVLRDATVVTQIYLGRNLQDASTGVTVRANTPHHVVSVFDTPAAGAHTYKLAAFVSSAGNGTSWKLVAGLGGTGNLAPAFLRVTKA